MKCGRGLFIACSNISTAWRELLIYTIRGGRDNFVSETDSAIRNKVNDVFNKYHSDQRNSRI